MDTVPKYPPLPECPDGVNAFAWIVRTAPMVRNARRAIAEQRRKEIEHERQEAAQPASRQAGG